MRYCFLFITVVFLSGACSDMLSEKDVMVKVGEKVLLRSDVEKNVPKGFSSADSLLFTENYVKQWTKNVLIYDIALVNLEKEMKNIDQLVETYRYSLIRQRYLEKLIQEKLVANIGEDEKKQYYENNKSLFLLGKPIIKGLFLKIPVDAPGLSDVKKWYMDSSVSTMEKIEKYSFQNANMYECFYDRWIEFENFLNNIPLSISNANLFLRSNKHILVSDDSFCYLLNIQDFIPGGAVAPYDYVEDRVLEMLINLEKQRFLESLENELYINAVSSGDVKNFTELQ